MVVSSKTDLRFPESGQQGHGARIIQMHSRICQVKASEKTEVKYMQSWEEKILIKQEGERIGLERINRLNQKLIEQGRFDDLTKATSDSNYQKKLLKEFKI